jgi:hypothetical protein
MALPRMSHIAAVLGAAVAAVLACAAPAAAAFQPVLTASPAKPAAGAFSPLTVTVARPDGQPYITGLTVALPPGLLATIRDVEPCRERPAARGACGAGARVGAVRASVESGGSRFDLEGAAALTGPYRGAPFGLSVALRAAPGAPDLGTTVVRLAIFVDPTDAHLIIVSDPFPTRAAGTIVGVRSVALTVDRRRFTFNPTSCGAHELRAQVSASDGSSAAASGPLQTSGCNSLGFRPGLSLSVGGRREMRDGGHPSMRALVTARRGGANLREVAVRLPLSLALDYSNAGALCSFDAGRRGRCPRRSVIGRARAFTRVLRRPLAGDVYLVQGMRPGPGGRLVRTLPTLLVALRGEVSLNLRAASSVERGAIVTTLEVLPDAPIKRFELELNGGRRGILAVTLGRSLCRGRQLTRVRIEGQNGARQRRNVALRTAC